MRFWTGSSNKRKKHFAAVFLFIAVSFACLFTGCGSKAVSLDADGNAPITSSWRLVSYTVNGSTTVVKDLHWFIKVFLSSKNPHFSCKDGVNCVITNNGKEYKGTVAYEDGVYNITLGQNTGAMTAVITGKTLTMVNAKGTLEFVFEAK